MFHKNDKIYKLMDIIRMMVQFFLQRDFTYKMKLSGKKCKLQKKTVKALGDKQDYQLGVFFIQSHLVIK